LKIQPVKIYKPDKKGGLKLVRVISSKEIIRIADEKFNTKKFNRKKSNNELFTPNETKSKQN
jgi:hypothetical protein